MRDHYLVAIDEDCPEGVAEDFVAVSCFWAFPLAVHSTQVDRVELALAACRLLGLPGLANGQAEGLWV